MWAFFLHYSGCIKGWEMQFLHRVYWSWIFFFQGPIKNRFRKKRHFCRLFPDRDADAEPFSFWGNATTFKFLLLRKDEHLGTYVAGNGVIEGRMALSYIGNTLVISTTCLVLVISLWSDCVGGSAHCYCWVCRWSEDQWGSQRGSTLATEWAVLCCCC